MRDRLIHRIAQALMYGETHKELHEKLVIGEGIEEQDFYFCFKAGELLAPKLEETAPIS